MKSIPAIPTFAVYSNRKIYDVRNHKYIIHEYVIKQIIQSEGKFEVSGISKKLFLEKLLLGIEEKNDQPRCEDKLLNILLNGGYYNMVKNLQNIIKEKSL